MGASRNARFAANFRHHPGIGGHRTPCYVTTPVSTPSGALRDARRSGHFFAVFGRENFAVMPKKSVCYCAPLPRRHPGKTKRHGTKQRNTKGRDEKMTNARETEFQTGDETLGRKRNWGPPDPVLRDHRFYTSGGASRRSPPRSLFRPTICFFGIFFLV